MLFLTSNIFYNYVWEALKHSEQYFTHLSKHKPTTLPRKHIILMAPTFEKDFKNIRQLVSYQYPD